MGSYSASKSLAATHHLNYTMFISFDNIDMKGEIGLFTVRHFAVGYISSKLIAEITKTRLNIPLQ